MASSLSEKLLAINLASNVDPLDLTAPGGIDSSPAFPPVGATGCLMLPPFAAVEAIDVFNTPEETRKHNAYKNNVGITHVAPKSTFIKIPFGYDDSIQLLKYCNNLYAN